jgi:hypothetical protein
MKALKTLKAMLRAFSWAAVGAAAVAVRPRRRRRWRGTSGRTRRAARPVLSVTSTGFPDGGEVPMHHAGRGDNKSPAFEFHWSTGNTRRRRRKVSRPTR